VPAHIPTYFLTVFVLVHFAAPIVFASVVLRELQGWRRVRRQIGLN
jgi:hypothetical protein